VLRITPKQHLQVLVLVACCKGVPRGAVGTLAAAGQQSRRKALTAGARPGVVDRYIRFRSSGQAGHWRLRKCSAVWAGKQLLIGAVVCNPVQVFFAMLPVVDFQNLPAFTYSVS
jgi:hypothetical protein